MRGMCCSVPKVLAEAQGWFRLIQGIKVKARDAPSDELLAKRYDHFFTKGLQTIAVVLEAFEAAQDPSWNIGAANR